MPSIGGLQTKGGKITSRTSTNEVIEALKADFKTETGTDAKGRTAREVIWIKITSNAQDGSNKRWKYAWSEVTKSTAGYGGWTLLTGGRSGTTSTSTAFNSIEDINGSSGAYGNGVTSTYLLGTIDIKPVPTNTIIMASLVPVGNAYETWFSYANGVDGACP